MRRSSVTAVLVALQLLWTGVAAADQKAGPVRARAAVAPLVIDSARVELKSDDRKDIARVLVTALDGSAAAAVSASGTFVSTAAIPAAAIPLQHDVRELSQAARELGADVVIESRIVRFDGTMEGGFRPALRETIEMETVIYEAETQVRIWHGRESLVLDTVAPTSSWTDKMIEANYLEIAKAQALPLITASVMKAAGRDLASYIPPASANRAAAVADFSSDVDSVPRSVTAVRKNAYAVVIGIEKYRDLPAADYAGRDARIVKEYLVRVMGFPPENVIALIDERATRGDIDGYVGTWLKRNVDERSTVFFYYAGHGSPSAGGEPFLIPYDGNPSFIDISAVPLKNIYQTLGALPAKEVFVVLDSCFSGGGGRSIMAKGSRPLVLSIDGPMLPSKSMVVLSAAKGAEISSIYPEKRHGLFTYFFLKGLQGDADITGDRTINIEKLYNYIVPNVKRVAQSSNRDQTPTITPNLDVLGPIARSPLAVFGK